MSGCPIVRHGQDGWELIAYERGETFSRFRYERKRADGKVEVVCSTRPHRY